MTPRTVFFDADGVLQGPGDDWVQQFTELVGIEDDDRRSAFAKQVKAAQKRTLDGSIDFDQTLAPVLTEWAVKAPLAEVVALWDRVVVDPKMVAEVRRLRADGIRCGLITNQNSERAAWMRTEGGYDELFDLALYSCDLGQTKPHPTLFAQAVSHLDHPPGQALFLDDHQHNVDAAREAGMRAELFAEFGGPAELHRILAAIEVDGDRPLDSKRSPARR